MTKQAHQSSEGADDGSTLLIEMLNNATNVLVKKLSNNDRDWARFSNKHQGGVYIPPKHRDGGFFPPLTAKKRQEGAPPILEAFFQTVWPQIDEVKRSRLVNYTSKGAETHMTGVPKAAFSELSPASFIVMAREGKGESTLIRCLTVDSSSDAATILIDALDLKPDFIIGERRPAESRKRERDRILTFAEEVVAAYIAGKISMFAIERAAMPATLVLAGMARAAFYQNTPSKT